MREQAARIDAAALRSYTDLTGRAPLPPLPSHDPPLSHFQSLWAVTNDKEGPDCELERHLADADVLISMIHRFNIQL